MARKSKNPIKINCATIEIINESFGGKSLDLKKKELPAIDNDEANSFGVGR